MRRLDSRLDGPILLEPVVHRDARGFFHETFRHDALGAMGVGEQFIQDNHSRSRRGVVRGMHFQLGPGVAKLVRCARGCILDVVIDLRRDSPTYSQWESFNLDDERLRLLYVPGGFAHGFCVLSEEADVIYKQTAYYDRRLERGIAFDDPQVGIRWPSELRLIASERDANAPRLHEIEDELLLVP